ncbi:hypothetical protein B4135_4127 [Caldibacillus debilis]|uniref:Uncharacterized protein n=1 Tax=Caldibacillus debilis TaxID=301148 RepID=A0A150L831_9BACI|nr:hypothetical protein B4135_4127 [Caldibacillus debilis]
MSNHPAEMLDIPSIKPKPMLNVQSEILDKRIFDWTIFQKC